ncbi:MAG: c-type cytochrome [Anaerolineae bacterium]|nr:c-type cytochrome [Anaerolineae bacterium]
MNWNSFSWRFYNLMMLIIVLVLLPSCSGLGGEPRVVATIPPSTPVPTEIGFPIEPPDLQVGAAVFAERCTACHGVTGAGDGPLIGPAEGQIPQGPRSFRDAATTADQTPFAWYLTITNGRIEKMMPPWRDALTEAERWSVAFYTYTLHSSVESVEQGKSLLESADIVADDVPLSESVNLTNSELLTRALGDAVARLQLGEQGDVQAYLRSRELLNYGAQAPTEPSTTPEALPQPAATAEAEQPPETVQGVVTGTVSNGTAGGSVPTDLIVTLNILDAEFRNETRQINLSTDGRFVFDDVPLQTDQSYIITVDYQGRTFGSDLLAGDPTAGSLELPVTIYELTNDPTVIDIIGLVWQVSVFEDTIQVAQVASFRNSSDRAFSSDELLPGGRYASVQLDVPVGAEVMSGVDQRYARTADGTAVIDTAPVLPGSEHLMQVVYRVPYVENFAISAAVDYAVSGPVRLLLAPATLYVDSGQLSDIGQETLRGVTYRAYGTSAPLSAGSTIAFTLGAPEIAVTSDNVPISTVISVMLLLVGAAVFGSAIYSYWRRKRAGEDGDPDDATLPDADQPLMDGLIREIAELDVAFSAGELDEDTYQQRRNKLKARLAEIMDRR